MNNVWLDLWFDRRLCSWFCCHGSSEFCFADATIDRFVASVDEIAVDELAEGSGASSVTRNYSAVAGFVGIDDAHVLLVFPMERIYLRDAVFRCFCSWVKFCSKSALRDGPFSR